MNEQHTGKLDLTGWPLPDDYLVEFGRITLLWARLEKFLATAVANLAGFSNLADPRIYIVFSKPDFHQHLALLRELCEHLAPQNPRMGGFGEVIEQLAAADESRRYYTSGGMATNPGDGRVEMEVASAADRFDVSSVTVEVTELQRVAVAIDAAQHALYKLVMTLEKPASVWVSE